MVPRRPPAPPPRTSVTVLLLAAGPARARVLVRRVCATAVLAAMLIVSAAVAPEPARADRDRNAEAWLVAAIDSERIDRGLDRLHTAGDMADVAAAWSARMAANGQLAHNPSYPDQICCWTVVSENVATVSGIEARGGLRAALRDAHRLLMGSSIHRANMLSSDVNEVGVGVYLANDTLWVTQNFRHRPDAPPPPPPPPPPPSSGASSSGSSGASSGGGQAAGTSAPSRPAFDAHEVQARLAELGWYVGEVDGVVGPLTLEAVTGLQTAAGLDADGRIGPETLAALMADDAPHRSGAGAWADVRAALLAVRAHALEVWSRNGYRPAVAGEAHPVLVVLDHLGATEAR